MKRIMTDNDAIKTALKKQSATAHCGGNLIENEESYEVTEEVNWTNNFDQQRPNNFNSYNPNRFHPNLSWKSQNVLNPVYNNAPAVRPMGMQSDFNQQKMKEVAQPQEDLLQIIMRKLDDMANKNAQFETSVKAHQEATDRRMLNMENIQRRQEMTIGQIASSSNSHKPGALPTQPEHVKAVITLRNGKQIDNNVVNEPETVVLNAETQREQEAAERRKLPTLHHAQKPYTPPMVPFPQRVKGNQQDKQYAELYNMLSKVEINLPLLDVIRNVPSYAKFFKELCSKKRKFDRHEKIFASEVTNSVLQHNLPPKLKDPGSFNVLITLGKQK